MQEFIQEKDTQINYRQSSVCCMLLYHQGLCVHPVLTIIDYSVGLHNYAILYSAIVAACSELLHST